ncbi:hypothetical protein Sjap_001264 [Stephania japonica]|uniref:Uncharacterized protein n=1 Tax=Stephania japonica TaxID=461633 RepID=A0AAP0KLD4_9MAGN
MEELKNVRDEVKAKAASAQAQSMACRPVVQGWLQRDIKRGIRKLLQKGSKLTEEGCMKGFCCSKNCWANHKLAKKTAKRLNNINDLKSKACEFDEVGDRHNVISVQAMPDSPELLNLGANHEVVVIMVVVSTKNLSTIQQEIGERLGWKSQTQDQRDDGVAAQHL